MSEQTKRNPARTGTELSDDHLDQASGGRGGAGNDVLIGNGGNDVMSTTDENQFGPSGSSGGDSIPMEEFSLNYEKSNDDPTKVGN